MLLAISVVDGVDFQLIAIALELLVLFRSAFHRQQAVRRGEKDNRVMIQPFMTFTAFTGAVSHFAIGGMPDLWCLVFCVGSTLLWARIAARFANKASPATLNRATGVVLVVLGVAIMGVNYIK